MSVRSIEISRQQAEELVDLIEAHAQTPLYELADELREQFGMASKAECDAWRDGESAEPPQEWALGPTVNASPALAAALMGMDAPEHPEPGNYTDVYVTIQGDGRFLLSESKG